MRSCLHFSQALNFCQTFYILIVNSILGDYYTHYQTPEAMTVRSEEPKLIIAEVCFRESYGKVDVVMTSICSQSLRNPRNIAHQVPSLRNAVFRNLSVHNISLCLFKSHTPYPVNQIGGADQRSFLPWRDRCAGSFSTTGRQSTLRPKPAYCPSK